MQNDKTENAMRNLLYGILQKIVNLGMPFVTRTVIIHTLGTEYLGLGSLFSSVLQVLNLAELGVGSAMIFSMYRPIAMGEKEKICALMALYRKYYRMIGLVILAAGLLVAPALPLFIKKDLPPDLNLYVLYGMNLGGTVLSYWLFAYRNSLLYAHQRNDCIDKTSAFVILIQQTVQIVTLLLFRNYYLYFLFLPLAQIAKNLINSRIAARLFPEYEPIGTLKKEEVRALNYRVRDLFISKSGNTVISSADSLVISSFLGLTALAIYQNYYYIMHAGILFVFLLFSSCTAGIGHSLVTETMEKNYRNFETLTFLTVWISTVCISGYVTLCQPFMELWAGRENLLSFPVVLLFGSCFYLSILCGLFSTYKDAAGIWHEDRFRPLVAAAVNLCLNLLMVSRYGTAAVLGSTVVANLIIQIPWLLHILFRVLFRRKAGSYVRKLMGYTIVLTAIAGICLLICGLIVVNGIGGILLKGVCCLLLSNVFLFLVYRKSAACRDCLLRVRRLAKMKYEKNDREKRKSLC